MGREHVIKPINFILRKMEEVKENVCIDEDMHICLIIYYQDLDILHSFSN
jgi:hypothetical protein